MGVILRISGKELDIDNFNLGWNLEPSIKHRKGDLGRKKKPISSSQLVFNVSNVDYSDLKEQIDDAIAFLNSNKKHLGLLSKKTGVEKITLSFAFNSRLDRINVVVQQDYFSPVLIRLAGSFNMGIELMQWPSELSE